MKLAYEGGKKLRKNNFPGQYNFAEERSQYLIDIDNIVRTGILSGYRGNASDAFFGGYVVRKFEKMFSEKFGTRALAVNSCTSALWVACNAIGLEPGDEVIVTPWSMSCSATVPLLFGAVPVFADIDPDTLCLAPHSIEQKITDKTKAIIVVDLFGGFPDWKEINKIATDNNLFVIEDAAQAIGAHQNIGLKGEKKYAGTYGDIGCFSFTQGKHLTSGEGGVVCTNNETLFKRCALARNHAEAVVNDCAFRDSPLLKGEADCTDMVGLNLRMTEIQAAIMIKQLEELDVDIEKRRANVRRIEEGLSSLPFIKFFIPRYYHSYYVLPFLFDKILAPDISRNEFVEMVKAELTEEEGRPDRGIPIGAGYIKPLYLMPVFQRKTHWAFKFTDREYKQGDCPVCEELQNAQLFFTLYHSLNLGCKDINDICGAFHKVVSCLEENNG